MPLNLFFISLELDKKAIWILLIFPLLSFAAKNKIENTFCWIKDILGVCIKVEFRNEFLGKNCNCCVMPKSQRKGRTKTKFCDVKANIFSSKNIETENYLIMKSPVNWKRIPPDKNFTITINSRIKRICYFINFIC